MNFKILIIWALFFTTTATVIPNPYDEYLTGKKPIRIGILRYASNIQITSDCPFTILDAQTNDTILTLPPHEICEITIKNSTQDTYFELLAPTLETPKTYKNNLIITTTQPTAFITIKREAFTKTYRGNLKLLITPYHKFTLVNELKIDEYLYGLLPLEISYKAHPQALATQAIVARTYALANLNKHNSQGFDLCATFCCQAYGGLDAEKPTTNQAVEQTKGQIITFNNKPIHAVFHATCGGLTEENQNVWDTKPLTYLRSIFDQTGEPTKFLDKEENLTTFLQNPPPSFCQNAPNYRWTRNYEIQELQQIITANLPIILHQPNAQLGTLKYIKILERSNNGRLKTIEIGGTQGTYQIHKDRIRRIFINPPKDPTGLPSTLFIIQTNLNSEGQPTHFKFTGAGYGHGVGLCQYGAQTMAKQGYTYQQIIQHYYPGVEIYTFSKHKDNL